MALVDPSRLSARLQALPDAEPLRRAIDAGGEEVYLVGGAVRDLWLGGAPVDFDLAVVGDIGPLAARLGSGVRLHERFQTATVQDPGRPRYDLAATRREVYARPGALPDVAAAGIEGDLRRRDFTVNALALGLGGPRRGELVSVADGPGDVAAGRLRVLHDASFTDDPTRLLRLARYAGRLAFTIEPRTDRLARAAAAGGALETVSGSRIGGELELLGDEPDPVTAFAVLRALGVDEAIAPGFGLGPSDAGVARQALALLRGDGGGDGDGVGVGDTVALLLGLAVRGVGDSQTVRRLFAHLGLGAARRDGALAVADADALVARLGNARRPSQVDAAIGAAPVEAVAAAAALDGPDALARRWLKAWRCTTIAITGSDLLAAGVPAGPGIAAGLRAARAARLDGHAVDRAAQLAEAIRAATGAGSPRPRADGRH